MPGDTGQILGLTFGLSDASRAGLRDFRGRIAALDGYLRLETEAALIEVSKQLEEAIKHEFREGTDKYGHSHDKTGATLRSLHVEYNGLTAKITMGGGAAFVEYGTPPHLIPAKSGGLLAFHWELMGGDLFYFKSVSHPGSQPDDFIGRAIQDLDMAKVLLKVFSEIKISQSTSGNWLPGPAAFSVAHGRYA